MSEESPEDIASKDEPAVLIGNQLRTAREARSMSIDEVARSLKLDDVVVNQLEMDGYDELPEPAYVRGYLLAYLKLLELPSSLLKSFDEKHSVSRPLLPPRPSVQTSCSQDGWVRCVSVGLIVLLVLALALWVLEQSFGFLGGQAELGLQQNKETQQHETNASLVIQQVRETPAEKIEQVVEEEDSPAEHVVDTTEIVKTPVVDEAVALQEYIEPPLLTLRFLDDSWIRVDNAQGKRLKIGTFGEGETINLTHDGPLHLTIGRIKNVEVAYAGKPVDLSGFGTDSVARLTVGQPTE